MRYRSDDYGEAIIVPYSEAGRFAGDLRRKDEYGKVILFGTQNWVHLGGLACELFRPPVSHPEHHSIKMKRLFPNRPTLFDEIDTEDLIDMNADIDDERLAHYLRRVRFNNA